MVQLSPQEVYDLTQRKFGQYGPGVVNEMYGIAMRESGGNTDAHNLNPATLDDSWGLWQINVRPNANPQYAHLDLTNPETNGDVAAQMFDQSGTAPWSTRMEDIGPPGSAPSEAGGGGGGSNPYNPILNPAQMETLPGLTADTGSGHYYIAGTTTVATQSDIRAALDRKYPDTATGYTPQQKDALALQYAQLAESKRGNDLSYGASIYGSNVSAANNAANVGVQYAQLGQSAYQFEQQQAFAKDQWLFQKQNAIDTLQLERDKYASTLAENARLFALEQQKLQFSRDQFAFTSGLALRTETRETQNQMFQQQATVAGIQLDMIQTAQHTVELNAQLQNEVNIFNAGKAADVSMFNIDEQTKVATFNAQAAMQTGQFNASMQFNVQQANVENERLRQQQLIDVASRIADAAKSPGDWGKWASLILANSGYGQQDAALAGSDLRSTNSLMPLEAMLRQREDIMSSDAHPFSFTPLVAPQLAAPTPATFTPAQAVQAAPPDFSGVNIPQPNITPFDPSSIPTSAPKPAPTYDSTKQNFIASGNTTVPGEQFKAANGQNLTAEQRAQLPDYVIQDMVARGQLPAMAGGGVVQSPAYIGDEKGAEMHIPFGNGNRAVIPADQTQQMMGGQVRSPFQQVQQNMSQQSGGGQQTVNQQNYNNVMGMPQGGYPPGYFQQQRNQPPQASIPQGEQPAQVGQSNTNFMGDHENFQMPQQGGDFMGWLQSMFQQWRNGQTPGMADGGVVQGPYMGSDEGASVNIPIPGTDMTIIMPAPKGKKGAKGAKGMKKMATGGTLYNEQGKTGFEDLVPDQDRQRAMDFLNEAGRRLSVGTPFSADHPPTPVFFSSPGTSPQLQQLGGAFGALTRGYPADWFVQESQRLAPAGYSEGAIGRTR